MAIGKVLDYSQARPPLAKVKAAGYSAVYRYVCSDVSEQGLPGKRLTPAERDAILAAGLDIGLHGEDEAGAARNGYLRGLEQGKQWADYAHTVLGAPKGMTIVAAIDYDTGGIYPQTVADYLHGVTDGLQGEYATGAYGSIYVVDAALAEKAAVHGVQTDAWSHGKLSTWAHLHQRAGDYGQPPGTDYNDVLRVPHGTWLQTLFPEGTDMSQAEVDDINSHIKAYTDSVNANVNGVELKVDSVALRLVAVQKVINALTTDAIASAVAAKIPVGGDLTADQVKAAAEEAVRDVLGGLNDAPPA